MEQNNSQNPAYPTQTVSDGGEPYQYGGLTKREYFAGLAMQGLLANNNYNEKNIEDSDVFRESVVCADELLKELEKV